MSTNLLVEKVEIIRLFVISFPTHKHAANALRALNDIKLALVSLGDAAIRKDASSTRTALAPAPETLIGQPEGSQDWPETFSGENGNYQNKCVECGCTFIGYKRRVLCKRCSPRNDITGVDAPVVIIRTTDLNAHVQNQRGNVRVQFALYEPEPESGNLWRRRGSAPKDGKDVDLSLASGR